MDDLRIDDRYTLPGHELQMSTSRSGGPGGQHVNTTDTRVRLRFDLQNSNVFPDSVRIYLLHRLAAKLTNQGELLVTASDSRSQHDNLESARERLRQLILQGLQRPRTRRKTKPSRAAKKRRVDTKKQRGSLKRSRQKPRHDD